MTDPSGDAESAAEHEPFADALKLVATNREQFPPLPALLLLALAAAAADAFVASLVSTN
jgi:hypothetical protein